MFVCRAFLVQRIIAVAGLLFLLFPEYSVHIARLYKLKRSLEVLVLAVEYLHIFACIPNVACEQCLHLQREHWQ